MATPASNNKRCFLITLDYELFGNGSGDVFKHVIEPTERLLAIARGCGVKYTFFFEVVEYWCLKREWESGNTMGYDRNPVEAMEAQMRHAVTEGHDVQLHIHPQWCNACWQDGRWNVDNSQWRLADYVGDIVDLLRRGKQSLEEMLRPAKPDYRCIALRAGAYNAYPSERIVKTMRKVGLTVDSSVVPGAVVNGALFRYNYSVSPRDRSWWWVDTKLELPADERTDLIELPIVSMPITRFTKYLSWSRIKSIWQNRGSAIETYAAKTEGSGNGNSNGLWRKIKYLFETEYQTWDICLLSSAMHRRFLKSTTRDLCVLVGHPKGLTDTDAPLSFLSATRGSHFTTVTRFYLDRQ